MNHTSWRVHINEGENAASDDQPPKADRNIKNTCSQRIDTGGSRLRADRNPGKSGA